MDATYKIPFAFKLKTSYIANRMILDTTWRILQRYIVSIPPLIVANGGILLDFTFALIEDTLIYRFYYNLIIICENIKVIEPDQGKILWSFIQG